MVGMIQILTYMFAIYLVMKGVEIFQVALMSSRPSRTAGLAIGGLSTVVCILVACILVFLQETQARSVGRDSLDSLGGELSGPTRYDRPSLATSPSRDYVAPPPLNPGPPPAQVKAGDAIKRARELLNERKYMAAYGAAHQGLNDPDASRGQRGELQVLAEQALRDQRSN